MSTKIHAASDALGNPIRLLADLGQENDVARACQLVEGLKADATIADKGNDANRLHAQIEEQGSEVVIPPRRHRKEPRTYDIELYKERNLIERFFNKLKQFRRVANRKLLCNFLGFVKLAAIIIWLK